MSVNTQAGEAKPKIQVARGIRMVTAVIALALVALTWYDNPILGGGGGFGLTQTVLLAIGLVFGAFCFAPLAWNTRALTLLISVSLTLIGAEFLLRLTLGPQFYGISQLDDRVLYRLIPGTQRVTTLPPINGSLHIKYKINSSGFRGKELAPTGASLRVVVYGDSFIQGDFSQTEDTFAERLKTHLSQRMGKSIEVVNAGVAGYGPDQELRRMEDELPILKPNLVIVAIYAGNDFGDLLRDKLYRLSSDGILQENPSWTFDPSLVHDAVISGKESILKKMLKNVRDRFFVDQSQIYPSGQAARRARMDANLAQAFTEYRQYVVEGDNVVHQLYQDPYNADISLAPKSESARYKIKMMEQIIARMHKTAAAQHVPLLFVLIPNPIDVADMHETGEVDKTKYSEYRRSTLTDTLDQICQRNQLPAVNLFGPFWAERTRDLYLKGGDDHWNERGQDFAAELVSNFVTSQDLLRIQTKSTP